jgi:hypothetical protein
MATNRAMLKEAIADAKAVKETAIANAKAALEEAFTPQLKSMLSMKLQEMEVEEDDYVTDKTEHDDKPYSTKKAADVAGYLEEEDTMMEVDLEELLAELEENEMEEGLYEAEETEEDEMSDEEETEDEAEPIDLEDMTDEDLKSMIEDVIADMIKSGELEAGNESEEEEESEEVEDEEVEDEEVDLAELLREIEGLEEETETEGLEGEDKKIEDAFKNINEIQLNEDPFPTAAEWVPILTAIGGLLSSGYALNTLKSYINKKASEGSEKFQKIKNALAKVGDIASSAYKGSKGLEEETEPTKDLEEAYSTIETLKSELNEINLLNAKLLYTNKIFKSKTLNENQKVKVLSSFDKAKNVGEVKMVFETLNEGIKVSKNTINENLGRASKGTMAPNVKKPIVESNEAFLRMQKLAGII